MFLKKEISMNAQVQVKTGGQATTTSGILPLGELGEGLVDPRTQSVSEGNAQIDPAVQKQAQEYADQLLAASDTDFAAKTASVQAIESMGLEAQRSAARKSQMLEEPIHTLSVKGADGGPVANALIELKVQVEALDPYKFDFEPGWFGRMVDRMPVVGGKLKTYFAQYESAQTAIDAIIRSLMMGRDQLGRDNSILSGDKIEMQAEKLRLERTIDMAHALDLELESRLAQVSPEHSRHKFIQEELLFPLRQRQIDLGQQLAVTQQGIIAMELVLRNNLELIRGVNRALTTTVSALKTAVVVALALAHQKIVLDKITALNTTTSALIQHTSERLKSQGVAIQKQASTAMLDMNALKTSFKDLTTAIDDISAFRVKALEEMSGTIGELMILNHEAGKVIERMESGNRARPELLIEVK
jgi:uncharacterized protein YaaN involved in tellurite resistance